MVDSSAECSWCRPSSVEFGQLTGVNSVGRCLKLNVVTFTPFVVLSDPVSFRRNCSVPETIQ